MPRWFHDLLTPPTFADEELTRRARLLLQLILSLFALSLLSTFLAPFFFHNLKLSFLFLAAFDVFLVVAHVLLRRGHVNAGSRFVVSIYTLFISVLVVLGGGTASMLAVYWVTCPFLAGLLLGRRAMAIATLFVVGLGLVLILLAGTPYAPPRIFPVPPMAGWVDLTLVTLLIGIFLQITLTSLASALRDARAELAERKRAEAEKERLEGQLRQAQRMEAMGRLAGGVAHDFNNLLTAIVGNLALARLSATGKAQLELLDEIRRGTDSATALTRQLLAFSRKNPPQARPTNLGDLVAGLHKMLVRLIGEDIKLELVRAPDLGLANVDPSLVEQVLLNLAANGRDAMPDGGRLTISVTEVDVEPAPGHAGGRTIRVSVSDTGGGIDPMVLDRIFEPFVTTKPAGRGTGLGLATVYAVATGSGGFVEVDSKVGVGTTFHVHFPRLPGTTPAPEAAATPPPVVGGSEAVLFVEDDVEVRSLGERVLARLGYRATACADADAALALLRARPFDLLVSDVVMPGMSGHALAAEARRVHPGLKVLLCSGHTAEIASSSHDTFLAKPYSPDELARKVRELLDRKP